MLLSSWLKSITRTIRPTRRNSHHSRRHFGRRLRHGSQLLEDRVMLSTVTLSASPTEVTETGEAAIVYTFERQGDLTDSLTVSFDVQGSAVIGEDYTALRVPGIPTLQDTPLLHLPMDETSPDLFGDVSGNGLDGSCVSETCPIPGQTGIFGTSTRFEHAEGEQGDYLSVPVGDRFNQDFTVEAWINWSGGGGGSQVFLSKPDTASETGWALLLDDGKPTMWFKGQPADAINANTALTPNTWTHIAATHDAANMTASLYVNGVLVDGQVLVGDPQLSSSEPILVGRQSIPGADSGSLDHLTFPGLIDEVIGYDSILTDEQIRARVDSFPATDREITFDVEQAITRLVIAPIIDTQSEANETVRFTLVPGDGYTIGTEAAVTTTILDDGVSISSSASTNETTSTEITFHIGEAVTTPTSIEFSVSGLATIPSVTASDYTLVGAVQTSDPSRFTVEVAADTRQATVTLEPIQNDDDSIEETVVLELLPRAGYSPVPGASTTTTIISDVATVVTVSASADVAEDEGGSVTYTIGRDSAADSALRVRVQIAGNATPDDYTVSGGQSILNSEIPGDGSKIYRSFDNEEPDGVLGGSKSYTGSTYNSVAVPEGTLAQDFTAEAWVNWTGQSVGYTQAFLSVPLNLFSAQCINFCHRTLRARAPGWSLGIDSDGKPTFAASRDKFGEGENRITSGSALNPGEWTHVAATYKKRVSGGGVDSTVMELFVNGARVNILSQNNFFAVQANAGLVIGREFPDTPSSLGVPRAGYQESGFRGLIDEVAVYNLALTSAELGSHIPSVVISAGQSRAELVMHPVSDRVPEADEDVRLTLMPNSGYVVPVDTAVAYILDDDVTLSVNATEVREDVQTPVVYEFERKFRLDQSLSVDFSIGGSAVYETDFELANDPAGQSGVDAPVDIDFDDGSGTATFGPGVTKVQVRFVAMPDDTVEEDTTLTLSIDDTEDHSPTEPVIVTFTDDDVSLSVDESATEFLEDAGNPIVYEFKRMGGLSQPLSVTFSFGSTAELDSDFELADGQSHVSIDGNGAPTVEFAAQDETAQVIFVAIPDNAVEDDKTLSLRLDGSALYGGDTTLAASVVLLDDDSSVELLGDSQQLVESGDSNATYTLHRTGFLDRKIFVSLPLTGSAIPGEDYDLRGAGVQLFGVTDTPDPLFHLPLNEETAGIFNDASENNNDGRCNPDTCPIPVPLSAVSSAFRFESTESDYISVPVGSHLDANFTVEAWINWNGGNGSHAFLSKPRSLAQTGWAFLVNSGKLEFRFTGTAASGDFGIENAMVQSEAAVIPSGTWTHVAATYKQVGDSSGNFDSTTAKLYVNGALSSEVDTSSIALPSTGGQTVLIGREFRPGVANGTLDHRQFPGLIGEVIAYDRELTADQIAELTTGVSSVPFARGQSTASITIAPIDDLELEQDKTVSAQLLMSGTGYTAATTPPIVTTIVDDETDLSIVQTRSDVEVVQGQQLTIQVVVHNNGYGVTDANVSVLHPMLKNVTWETTTTTGAEVVTAETSVDGKQFDSSVDLPDGSTITYTITGTVAQPADMHQAVQSIMTLSAEVTAPDDVIDADLSNNKVVDSDIVLLAAVGGTGNFELDSVEIGNKHRNTFVVLGDLDGDGDPDALKADTHRIVYMKNTNGAFLGKSDSFQVGQVLVDEFLSTGIQSLALGDLNGNGLLDAFVVRNSGLSNFVLINEGGGKLVMDPVREMSGTDLDTGVSLGDLDGDGDLDALVVGRAGFRIWHNDGNGVFSPGNEPDLDAMGRAQAELGDVDGDGDLDAVVELRDESTEIRSNRLYLNQGDGSFNVSEQGSLGSFDTVLGDLDGDGDLDALSTSVVDASPVIYIWTNNGEGQFTRQEAIATDATFAGRLSLGDVDGDGDLDVFHSQGLRPGDDGAPAGVQRSGNSNVVLLNNTNVAGPNPTIEFSGTSQRLGNSTTIATPLADLDGDGDLDAFELNDLSFRIWQNEDTERLPPFTLPESGETKLRLNTDGDATEVLQNGSNVPVTILDHRVGSDTIGWDLKGTEEDDRFVLDFSRGNPIPPGGLRIDASGQTSMDTLVISGGAFETVNFEHINATDGLISFKGSGIRGSVEFIDFEPIDLTGSTISHVFFGLPHGDDQAVLEHISGNISNFYSDNATFESAMFRHPSGSLTIDAGGGNDMVRLKPHGQTFSGDVVVHGGPGDDHLDAREFRSPTLHLAGNHGDDLLLGSAGHDTLMGEEGHDTLIGGSGSDNLDGGDGDNVFEPDYPTVSIARNVNSSEGDSGEKNFVFTIELSRPSELEVLVSPGLTEGTATGNVDFLLSVNLIVFPPGTTRQEFSVVVFGDTDEEDNETFHVSLSNPVHATIGIGNATGTIANDDVPPSFYFSVLPSRVQELVDHDASVDVHVWLTEALATQASVFVITADGTAQRGLDYEGVLQRLTFPPGTTHQELSIPVYADGLNETTEYFDVFLRVFSDAVPLLDPDLQISVRIVDSSAQPPVRECPPSSSTGGHGNDRIIITPGQDHCAPPIFVPGGGVSGAVVYGTPGDDDILIGWELLILEETTAGDHDDEHPAEDGHDHEHSTVECALTAPFCTHVDVMVVNVNGEITRLVYNPENDQETIFVFAGAGDDVVIVSDDGAGQHWNAEFHGQAGNDTLIGASEVFGRLRGNDRMFGGEGDDLLIGNAGIDLLDGGSGFDRVFNAKTGDELVDIEEMLDVPAGYRVNSGGPQVSERLMWEQDTAESPSPWNNNSGVTVSTSRQIDLSHPSIPAGTPVELFQSQRVAIADEPEMEWDFTVVPGQYHVHLYFAEILEGAQTRGAREFDVSIEGETVLHEYDTFADVGAFRGVVKTFTVSSDDNLDIDFHPIAGSPAVQAIEIVSAAADDPLDQHGHDHPHGEYASPDLRPEITAPVSNSISADDIATFELRVWNNGTAPSEPSRTVFYLSRDHQMDDSDRVVGILDTGVLAAGTSSGRIEATILLPAAGDPFWDGSGSYYLVTMVDAGNSNLEANKENNISVSTDLRVLNAAPMEGRLDVDNDGAATPLRDGVLVIRYMAGFRGHGLTIGVPNQSGNGSEPNAIEAFLNANPQMLDPDGDGRYLPLTDGVLILRHLAGFTGNALVVNAVNPNGTRTDPEAISAFLNQFLPVAAAPAETQPAQAIAIPVDTVSAQRAAVPAETGRAPRTAEPNQLVFHPAETDQILEESSDHDHHQQPAAQDGDAEPSATDDGGGISSEPDAKSTILYQSESFHHHDHHAEYDETAIDALFEDQLELILNTV